MTTPVLTSHEFHAHVASRPFRPAWWLPNAHLQTIWAPFFRERPPRVTSPERWGTPDDDFIYLHMATSEPRSPVVLLLHGLEGSVDSHYMRGLTHAFASRRWNVAAMEHRSCSGELNRAERMYHSGETTDLAWVVGELEARFPGSPIYLAGVSLGANQILKWLGESGDDLPESIMAAAAVSPPFDLTISGPATDKALGGLYTRKFLRTLIPKAIEKDKQYPGVLGMEELLNCKTFEVFDTHGTAALHGFRDAWDYWEKVSCGQFLEGIRRPTLIIAAEDDPFNPGITHPTEVATDSPFIHPLFTRGGGHVGFVEGPDPWRSRFWAEDRIVNFFTLLESRRQKK